MRFQKTQIPGLTIIELEQKIDDRGFLARIWDNEEFVKNGISFEFVQGYMTHTKKKGTIRGLHFQVEPSAEAKLTRCVRGAVYEVVVDLRKDSTKYLEWEGYTFKADDYKMLYVPKNFAHAILTLEDNTEFMNYSSQPYKAECEKGIRYDDPFFSLSWPIPVSYVSEKDKAWPDFNNLNSKQEK